MLLNVIWILKNCYFFPFHFSLTNSKIIVFFKNSQVEVAKRVEFYTISDFLAYCGGLLGLFLGISALSIIELIYYCTLQFYWTIWTPDSSANENSIQQKISKYFNTFRLMRGIRIFIDEFCDSTNIHGFIYLTHRRLNWMKRSILEFVYLFE